tara:strand:+ start:888 stop:1832 length:945 start_codon:yes stop_codon:yes gene_type:complete
MSDIILQNVTKSYGNVQGISDINLSIGPGITGILGPNGAGKSTTMKLILGLSKPSIGMVTVNNIDPFTDWKSRRNIGFAPEYDCFYEHMTGIEYVSYFLRMHDFDEEEAEEIAKKELSELGLDEAMHRRIRTYSRGMRQKTKVARATAFNPSILVLDEPFQGADPSTRHLLMQKMKDWAGEGKIVLISSHILNDVENLTDSIILINNGRMLASGNRHEIRKLMANIPRKVNVAPNDKSKMRTIAKRMLDEDWITSVNINEKDEEIVLETNQSEIFYRELPKIIQKEKIGVKKINSDDDSLDSLYEKLVEGEQWK